MNDKKKTNLTNNIPVGILKVCADSYVSILTKFLNTSLERGYFLNQLQLVEVTTVFKKEDGLSKKLPPCLCFFQDFCGYLKK